MTTPTSKSSYSLYKPLAHGRYLVRRITDGELLLAEPLDLDPNIIHSTSTSEHGRTRTLLRHGACQPAAALLNHENLLCIYDELVAIPLTQEEEEEEEDVGGMRRNLVTRRMLVYDYCDMGTLQDLFDEHEPQLRTTLQHHQEQVEEDDGARCWGDTDTAAGGVHVGNIGTRRRHREKEVEEAIAPAGGFFPEAFIWHVALGLLRALQWLHEGVGDTYGVSTPRGIETFAPVKLGNFGKCWASGGVVKSMETPVVAMPEKDEVPLGLLRERAGRWKRDGFGLERSERPYTRGSELCAVGAMLYEMMCGRPLPPADECSECGCVHITANDAEESTPCDHDCVGDVNIQKVFEPLFQYTAGLKELVMHLLRLNYADNWYASTVLDHAWAGFESWAAKTEDGRLYRDTFDNIWLRRQNLTRLKK
ncbi:hypothetical protein N657DRAFT_687264 [Parathielavia appendiculata]|uniref:non-specific serine/threonine protein kinase n=1 Tax=Parathielavia appendiculata TaxID=2587402 RepID=A0AAN6U5Y6_9PEZI|nr:hypothetical protein N657DRAFT_687264 [Parathielavia appendiculata]